MVFISSSRIHRSLTGGWSHAELGTRSFIRGSLSAPHSIFSHESLTLLRSFFGFPFSLLAQSLIAPPVVRSAIKCQNAHKKRRHRNVLKHTLTVNTKNTNIHSQPKSLGLFISLARIYRPSFRINKHKTLVFNGWKRVFWACFHECCVYKFGHMSVPHLPFSKVLMISLTPPPPIPPPGPGTI